MISTHSSTESGTTYYRLDQVTVIATANSGDLTYKNGLNNPVWTAPALVFTGAGAGPSYTQSNCNSWSKAVAQDGNVGNATAVTGWSTKSDTGWAVSFGVACQSLLKLYCVEQMH